MILIEDLHELLDGQIAVVSGCEARDHGENMGCLCKLRGERVIVGKKYETPFAGTVSFWLRGKGKTARLSELTLVKRP